jgi:putative transcriptional regulator
MIPENPSCEELAEWAALYALDALAPAERAEIARRAEADSALRAEIERLRPVADALAEAAPAVPPRPEVLDRVLARVRSESTTSLAVAAAPAEADPARPWRQWPADCAASTFVAASQGEFEPTSIPGISVRRLFVDRTGDRVTMLVRMNAGTRYPAHRHGGPEECYVLAGDLSVGGEIRMRAGDYQRVERGSVHPVQTTEQGCLLLIVSSLHDELLEGAGR